MKPFFAALKFLTLLPIPSSFCGGEKELTRSKQYFFAAGFMMGGILASLWGMLQIIFSSAICGALTVAFSFILTRGLHIDGLADTLDALFSSKSKEEKLCIMKDSRIGPMGAFAVVMVVILKVITLGRVEETLIIPALFVMPFTGRIAMTLFMEMLPYARKEGLGLIFVKKNRNVFILQSLLLILVSLFFEGKGVVFLVTLAAFLFTFRQILFSQIGGWTGDTLGAICEISETIFLLILSSQIHP